MTCSYTPKNQSGFTLAEISIVLVIIGLVVGGVLVGRDLIFSSEVRKALSQIEKIDAAAQAFKIKYDSLPGDIQPSRAAAFGLFQITGTCTGACVNRFEDDLINYSFGGGTSIVEYNVFWRHLSEANMIEGRYGFSSAYPINASTGDGSAYDGSAAYYDALYPSVLLGGEKYYLSVLQQQKRHTSDAFMGAYYGVAYQGYTIFPIATDDWGGWISGFYAYALDSKIDDGMPNTGNTFEYMAFAWGATPEESGCTYGGTFDWRVDVQYTSTGPNAYAKGCYLHIKTGF